MSCATQTHNVYAHQHHQCGSDLAGQRPQSQTTFDACPKFIKLFKSAFHAKSKNILACSVGPDICARSHEHAL